MRPDRAANVAVTRADDLVPIARSCQDPIGRPARLWSAALTVKPGSG